MLCALRHLPGLSSPELREVFADIPLETLEASDSVVYAADADFRLVYVNPAWDRFAIANEAPHLQRAELERLSILDVSGPLRNFYSELFDKVVSTEKPAEHRFLCSSHSRYREFQMRVLPLRSGGVLISEALIVERPHNEPASSSAYLDSDRIITMCSHCRRTKRLGTDHWDWVPEYVAEQPPQASHGLCPICLEFHYLSLKRS